MLLTSEKDKCPLGSPSWNLTNHLAVRNCLYPKTDSFGFVLSSLKGDIILTIKTYCAFKISGIEQFLRKKARPAQNVFYCLPSPELSAQPEQQEQLQSGVWDASVPGLHLWQHHRGTGLVGTVHQWEECRTHQPDCGESDWVLPRSLSREPGDGCSHSSHLWVVLLSTSRLNKGLCSEPIKGRVSAYLKPLCQWQWWLEASCWWWSTFTSLSCSCSIPRTSGNVFEFD